MPISIHRRWEGKGIRSHPAASLLIKEAFPGTSVVHPHHYSQQWTERKADWSPVIPEWKEITDQKKFPAGLTFKASNTRAFKKGILMQRIHGWAQLIKGIQTRGSTFKGCDGWTFAE